MKLFMAGLGTETNSFSPLPTGQLAFDEGGVYHGDATSHPLEYATAPLHVWRNEATGMDVVESLSAHAQPAGPTVRAVYEGFRNEILRDLKAALPVDIVLLSLHGAMIADGYDDCEGDLIGHVRRVAPDAVIGALLDPHCNLTAAMLEEADVLVAYKEYPHVDVPERAADLLRICTAAARGQVRPAMAEYDCRMVLAMPTPTGPMRTFVDRMIAKETTTPGILSLSVAHGFPWADTARSGMRTVAITDGDAALAERIARELGEELWALRHDLNAPFPGIDEALDRAQAASEGPVVLADMADNPGGGAPGDATFLLRAMLARGMTSVAAGIFHDPGAVRICREAGKGATLPLRIGGKTGQMSGDPIDLTVTVRACASGLTQRFGSLPAPLGEMVWVEANGIDIVLNDTRTQTFHPEAFTGLGIDLAQRRYVVVKSSNHYQAGFRPIAAQIIPVATPGAITPDFANIPYVTRSHDYWPRIEDPFA